MWFWLIDEGVVASNLKKNDDLAVLSDTPGTLYWLDYDGVFRDNRASKANIRNSSA